MQHTIPTLEPAGKYKDDQVVWVGLDDRGVEMEIAAVVKGDVLLVIHVMPTYGRRTG